MAALAADAAEDACLRSIISAPLFYTLGVNSFIFHSSSISERADYPLIVQFLTSGYIVGEWLPQIHNYLISVTLLFVLRANCVNALLWSNLVIAVKFSLGIPLA